MQIVYEVFKTFGILTPIVSFIGFLVVISIAFYFLKRG